MTRGPWSALVALVVGVLGTAAAASQQASPAAQGARAESREQNLRAYTELLRSDVRTQKVAVITELMMLTEAQDKSFWPIYRDYELELSRINDDRLRLIERYADVHDALTDPQADELITKALELESRRTALKQRYYNQLKGALSPRLAAKAVQIEHQLELLVDLQIAASLPIASTK